MGVALALVFVLLLLVAFNALPGLAPEKIQQAQVFYSKMPEGSGFSVSLEPPPSRFSPADNPALELILTNTRDNPITIRDLFSSGCLHLTIDPKPPMTVGAHQSIRPSATLRPLCDSGQFQLTLSFAWEEGSSKAHYQGFAATSPITVASSWDEAMPRFFRIVSAMLRDFSWPVVLLLVGYWLQLRLAKRDTRIKEEQDARDSRGRILNTVLPDYSKLVQEHYLAISRHIDKVGLEAKDYSAQLKASAADPGKYPPAPDRVLCSILLMRARVLKLLTKKGGIYFVSSVAEELFSTASLQFMKRCYDLMGKDELDDGIELLGAEDTFTAALKKCRGSAHFSKLEFTFSKWLRADWDEFNAYVQLLRIMSAVLSFECNRPFYQVGPTAKDGSSGTNNNWYIDPPLIEMESEMYEVPPDLLQLIHGLLSKWLSGVPAECRFGVPPLP